jgi:hypothetical protein
MGKHTFYDEASWLEAWKNGVHSGQKLSSGRGAADPDFKVACEHVAGCMSDYGFRIFHNGGLPLLQRRIEDLVEEMVLEPGPRSASGVYIPLSVRIHVSHEGMRGIRERYWVTPSAAPTKIAGGMLGQLNDPPVWVIWDVAGGGMVLHELARWVASSSLEWLDLFEDPERLRESVLNGQVPLLDAAYALEFVMLSSGRDSARRFFREIIEFGARVSPKVEPLKRIDANAPFKSRLEAIATCYRLR